MINIYFSYRNKQTILTADLAHIDAWSGIQFAPSFDVLGNPLISVIDAHGLSGFVPHWGLLVGVRG